jgi:hypothetical protein
MSVGKGSKLEKVKNLEEISRENKLENCQFHGLHIAFYERIMNRFQQNEKHRIKGKYFLLTLNK